MKNLGESPLFVLSVELNDSDVSRSPSTDHDHSLFLLFLLQMNERKLFTFVVCWFALHHNMDGYNFNHHEHMNVKIEK